MYLEAHGSWPFLPESTACSIQYPAAITAVTAASRSGERQGESLNNLIYVPLDHHCTIAEQQGNFFLSESCTIKTSVTVYKTIQRVKWHFGCYITNGISLRSERTSSGAAPCIHAT